MCMWSQKPRETVSEIINFKNFLGKHTPRPPSLGALEFPPYTCINPCIVCMHLHIETIKHITALFKYYSKLPVLWFMQVTINNRTEIEETLYNQWVVSYNTSCRFGSMASSQYYSFQSLERSEVRCSDLLSILAWTRRLHSHNCLYS